MLKIKVVDSDESKRLVINQDGTKTDEESKLSDTQFINDTSDFIQSDA